MKRHVVTLSMGSLALLLAHAHTLLADTSDATNDSSKKQAITWVDTYRGRQALFHDEDIAQLRKKLSEGTDTEAREWLEKTKEPRQVLDSERWQQTQKWLRQFLRVQAIYSDEQIEELRSETLDAAKTSPTHFKEMLLEMENFRQAWTQGITDSKQLRKREEQVKLAYKKEVATERAAARKKASAQGNSGRPVKPVKKPEYHRPPALINSLDAARFSVMRSFWRPW